MATNYGVGGSNPSLPDLRDRTTVKFKSPLHRHREAVSLEALTSFYAERQEDFINIDIDRVEAQRRLKA